GQGNPSRTNDPRNRKFGIGPVPVVQSGGGTLSFGNAPEQQVGGRDGIQPIPGLSKWGRSPFARLEDAGPFGKVLYPTVRTAEPSGGTLHPGRQRLDGP